MNDNSIASEVHKLGDDILKMFQHRIPRVFAGDVRDVTIASLVLAEALGGVLVAARKRAGQEGLRSTMETFNARTVQVADLVDGVASGRLR